MVVTTNGGMDRDGSLLMNGGVAGAAKRHLPGIEGVLGKLVKERGNVPIALPKVRVLTWPTKLGVHTLPDGRSHAGWMCISRVDDQACKDVVGRLTARSGERVIKMADEMGLQGPIFLPRPGCGLGGLDWSKVKPWMQERFDDRFVVVDPVR